MPIQTPTPTHQELLQRLTAEGPLLDGILLEDTSNPWWRNHSIAAAVGGRLPVRDRSVRVRVGLPHSFPRCLPEIAVEASDPAFRQPHVDHDGKLCYQSDEGVLLDRRDPWGVLVESLELASGELDRSSSGDQAVEFVEELYAYWGRDAGSRADCVVIPGDEATPLTAFYRSNCLIAVAGDLQSYAASRGDRSASGLSHQNALYLPVDPLATLPGFRPQDLGDFPRLLAMAQAALPVGTPLFKRLQGHRKQEELVLLGVRRPDGTRLLVGLRLHTGGDGHPLVTAKPPMRIEPIGLRRFDLGYLAPRGGADEALGRANILLLGCGAVGGYVAMNLARAGVGALCLVDKDTFTPENTYRHVCGMARLGERKAHGLKAEIYRAVPHINVTAHHRGVDAFLHQGVNLSTYDLIISALGDPTTDLWLNEKAWSTPGCPPVLFAWLEPLGLGGHVLAVRTPGVGRGCLECLYDRPQAGGPLVNRAAFAKAGPTYTRDLLGCGSRHLPFGDLDAQRTAELVARLSIGTLKGDRSVNMLASWKGDGQAFHAAGHETTPRFGLCQQELDDQRTSHARATCPTCGQ